MTGASQSGPSSDNALSFTYDALGRKLTQVGPQGTVTSIWDIGGRRTRITHPDGFYVEQDYLVTGELAHIRENGASSGAGVLATYAYDDLGRRTSLTQGDGTTNSYTFDPVSRLSQLAHDLSGTSYDQTLGFSYNPASEIRQNTRSNDAYAWTGHYNVNRGYTANGLNQYTASGSVTPTYDTKGNLTSAGSTTYTYSSENLLTAASGGITLAYDPAMRLYQTAGGTPGTTRFGYDGADLIAEYNSSNGLQRRYVHGPGTDEPVVWYEGTGTSDRRFLHTDERGSVVAVGSSSGTSVNTYDEYGIPRSTNSGRFQYTGQTWLPELGMYYYKARIYSPTLGRFLQTDPIGYAAGMNRYAYVGGNPINRTDPSGLQQCYENYHYEYEYYDVNNNHRHDPGEGVVPHSASVSDSYGCLPDPQGSDESRGPMVLAAAPAAQPPGPQKNTQVACSGYAYVMRGNSNFLTKPHYGAFGALITPNSIAIIPRQWSGTPQWNSAYKSFGPSTFGWAVSADGKKSLAFSGITDVINNLDIASNALAAQDIIMSRAPGDLVLEVTGGMDLGSSAKVLLFTDNPSGCPAGTSQYRG
jgi:RHS repeat-associated protein